MSESGALSSLLRPVAGDLAPASLAKSMPRIRYVGTVTSSWSLQVAAPVDTKAGCVGSPAPPPLLPPRTPHMSAACVATTAAIAPAALSETAIASVVIRPRVAFPGVGPAAGSFEVRGHQRQGQRFIGQGSTRSQQDAAVEALEAVVAQLPESLPTVQATIQQAYAAGVSTFKVQEYVTILDREMCRWAARKTLREGLSQRSPEALGVAIAQAREAGLTPCELGDACQLHKALVEEAQREQIRRGLKKAVDEGWDLQELEQAIQQARSLDLDLQCVEFAAASRTIAQMLIDSALLSKDMERLEKGILQGRLVGVAIAELSAANDKLDALRRDAMWERFREALRLRDRTMLEEAVQQGVVACVGKEVLAGMHQEFSDVCAQGAREQLEEALAESDMDKIEEAIEHGSPYFGLEELHVARQKLVSLRLSAAVARATRAPFLRNIGTLRDTIQRGREHGLDDEKLEDAIAVLNWAELNIQEEVCDICYEEVETDTMPCCGRNSGGGRVCQACLARLLKAQRTCPFCRTLPSCSTPMPLATTVAARLGVEETGSESTSDSEEE